MLDGLRDGATLTAVGLLALGGAVAVVVVAFVLIATASLWMKDSRRTQALAVLDRLLKLVTVLRGGMVARTQSPSDPALGAASGP